MKLYNTILLIVFSLFQPVIYGQDYKIGDLITNEDGSQGIVCWLHPDGSGGWMVALQNAGTAPMTDGSEIPTLPLNGTSIDMNGYAHTQAIRDYQGNNPAYAAGLVDFANGWYIPAWGQLDLLMSSIYAVNPALTANGGQILYSYTYYATSTQQNSGRFYQQSFIISRTNVSPNQIRAIKDFSSIKIEYDSTLTYRWNTGETTPYIQVTPTETTTYTVSATSEAGCETVAAKTIIVNDVAGQSITDSICDGATYSQHGFTVTSADFPSGSNIYTETKTIYPSGCAVEINLSLTRNAVYKDTIRDTICLGTSYINQGYNIKPPQQGDFLQTFHYNTTRGCDSLITIGLYVQPTHNEVIKDTICQHTPYVNPVGFNLPVQTVSGDMPPVELKFTNQFNCDSSFILNLHVKQVYEYVISDHILVGDSYNKNGFTYPVQSAPVSISDTLFFTGSNGCDSITILNLNVTQLVLPCSDKYHTINQTICENEPFFFNGAYRNTPGTYQQTIALPSGCDSIVTLNLSVNPIFIQHIVDTIPVNTPYTDYGFSIAPVSVTSNIRDTLKFKNQYNCDSLITLKLHVKDFSNPCTKNHLIRDTICQFEAYVDYGFSIPESNLSGLSAHTLQLAAQDGCDSIVSLELWVNKVYSSETEVLLNQGEEFIFDGVSYYKPGVIVNSYQTEYGCDSTYVHIIKLAEEGACPPVVPDKYFSPNGDEINDYWGIKNINCQEHTVSIYDRFGKLLITYQNNFTPWDGTYLGNQQPSTDYWYLIQLPDKKIISGHFTLKR